MFASTYCKDNLVTDNFTNVEFYVLEFVVELPKIILKIPDVELEVRVHPEDKVFVESLQVKQFVELLHV